MPADADGYFNYERLYRQLEDTGNGACVNAWRQACCDALQSERHGLLPEWMELLRSIPLPDTRCWQIESGRVVVADPADVSLRIDVDVSDSGSIDPGRQTAATGASSDGLRQLLQRFRPWRKGPFVIAGVEIDTEWRSDLKWDRIADSVEWRDRHVLDVGCGNGYFGWRMLDVGARSVVGLDPFLLYVVQHQLIQRLAGDAANDVLPLTDECLSPQLNAFDIAVSMGVLYHRTSPVEHLQLLHGSLKRGGQLVLETLIIDADQPTVLVPRGRYARMRNVWFIPSLPMLTLWLRRTGFRDITVIDVTRTTSAEQRRTEWMTFESLADFLDPTDSTRTVEGYPAPVRACVTARVP